MESEIPDLTEADMDYLFKDADKPLDLNRFLCPRCGNESFTLINNTHFCASVVCNGRARWHDVYWKDLTDYNEKFIPSFPKRAEA